MKTTVLGLDTPDEPTNLETVAMTIDESSVQHLMSTMTNLYSDPVLAVIREYSSNALDSHIRAGVKTPILVELPTDNNLNFVVEDFGIGMSKDDIANIYSRYGLSTKNNTNAEIGAFGLGCKSALAITDRFDLIARKDGIETVAYIQKNNKGVGIVHFVSETPTAQPNGVKVTVPVSFGHFPRFKSSSETVFDTWAVGSVLVNGEPNKAVQYSDEWVEVSPAGEPIAWVKLNESSSFTTYRSYANLFSNTTFVIGGIAYNMERVSYTDSPFKGGDYEKLGKMVQDTKIIINLPIGSVDLTPSREQIMITDKTVKSINSIISDIAGNLRETMSNYIQGLDQETALRVYAGNFALLADEIDFSSISGGYRTNYRNHRPEFYGVKYHGEEIPTWVDVTKSYFELVSVEGQALGLGENVSRVFTLNTLNSSGGYSRAVPNNVLVVVDGVVDETVTTAFRKNLRDYSKSVYGRTTINAMLTNDTKINKWITATYNVVTFDVFAETARKYRSAKKSEAQTGSKRSAVSYAYTSLDNNGSNYGDVTKITADQIANDGQNIIFVSADNDRMANLPDPWTAVTDTLRSTSGSSLNTAGFHDTARMAFGSDKSIVFLNKGKSAEAFAKKFPKAMSYTQAIANVVDALKPTEMKTLAGIASAVYKETRNSQLIGYATNFTSVADALGKHNLVAGIKDANVRTVFEAMTSTGKMSSIARLLADVKLNNTVKLEKLHALMIEANYGNRFSLLNRMEVTRYYRVNELSEGETKQVVAFLNAC